MAKGAGMIHPRMATTLCFLMTDAAIAPRSAQGVGPRGQSAAYTALHRRRHLHQRHSPAAGQPAPAGVKLSPNEGPGLSGSAELGLADLAEMIARDGEGAAQENYDSTCGARPTIARRSRSPGHRQFPGCRNGHVRTQWGRILFTSGELAMARAIWDAR